MSERGRRAGELLLDSCTITRGGWELARSEWDGPYGKAQCAPRGEGCESWGWVYGSPAGIPGPWEVSAAGQGAGGILKPGSCCPLASS